MKLSGNPNVNLNGSTASLPEVPAGATPVLYPIEPRSRRGDASFEDLSEHSEYLSPSFEYDDVRLGAAEHEAFKNWNGSDRPTWKDLILKARCDAIDDSAWLFDLGQAASTIFEYDGMPLGEGEKRAYEQWQEEAQPTWEELVVNARMAELGHPRWIADQHESLGGDSRSGSLKRKRSYSIDENENSSASFYYDEMKLGEAERAAYDSWGELEPPSWKDLVLKARRDAIDDSAWLFDLGQAPSTIFEYDGMPLGEGEKRAYEQWQEEAQPTWEELVVNARLAELGHPGWIADEHNHLEEVIEFRSNAAQGVLEGSTDQPNSSSGFFIYEGMRLGATERAVYENWTEPEPPSWEDLILAARQATISSSSVSSSASEKTSSSVFLYEGKPLGDAERQAYGRWRGLAQPRWQNLVVNARLTELDPSVWIPGEHDPFDEGEAFGPATQTINKSNPALANQSESGRPDLAREVAQETNHVLSPACLQLEARRVLYFGANGPDADQTESIADSDRFDGAGKVKRLGTKSRRDAKATTHDVNSSAGGLFSDGSGLAPPPPPSEKAVRSRNDNIGTYGSRRNERARLATETGKYESEHIFGFKVVHDTLRATKEGRRLERPMPAYLECKELHRQHVGTGRGRTGLVGRGWPDDASYRSDQRATLTDPVASAEGATASNGYQLNQLGYAHQLAKAGLQSESPDGVTPPIHVATTSYNYTVSRDPILSPPSKEQEPQLLQLGPRGQTEAVLARETALTGRWPTIERESQVYREFLALYNAKKDLDTKPLRPRQKKKALVSALDRTAGLIGASPLKTQSSTAEAADSAGQPEERRVYDPRDRGRDDAFNR
ncbi:virA/G regulated protein [Rhizobium rhizogenes]|uniref:virA/G regulated protein n=1 Tax=Rhizobium rhizogenes TaxID=359 RepID=UPI0022B694F4|nr:virA/G regulated protein [Rhizobium rhizogenes]MCZ7448300.1 virA/G regulated protein [Rhizobium rhizogenes]MCZ7465730.1 virA/G regulated protein [Rhizobium rhizogenes]